MGTKSNPDTIIKGSIVGGIINALINSVINWFSVKGKDAILLTDDMISSKEHTLFAGAVPSALILAFLITIISYFKTKGAGKSRYFPKVLLMALQHGIFAFGALTIFAILLQRFFGSIAVTPIQSVIIVGIISGLVGGIVDFMTKKSLLDGNH